MCEVCVVVIGMVVSVVVVVIGMVVSVVVVVGVAVGHKNFYRKKNNCLR